jgi:hypothetical protein
MSANLLFKIGNTVLNLTQPKFTAASLFFRERAFVPKADQLPHATKLTRMSDVSGSFVSANWILQ